MKFVTVNTTTVTRESFHRGVWPMKNMFLKFVHHNEPIRQETTATQESVNSPSGEVVSQIYFSYTNIMFMITRLYDAALGKYSVVAQVGEWKKVETGLTEAQADEFEDGVYALLYHQTAKV